MSLGKIFSVLWISMALFEPAASSSGFPVTITSNVTLHGIICCNQSIELTCHADDINVTTYKWTASIGKSIQSEYSINITVLATDELVEYTCTVTDISDNYGYSSVYILSNASDPALSPVNFNTEKTVYMNTNVNLTIWIFSNSLISNLTWSRVIADLPEDCHIVNYSKDGKNYTALIIVEASYSDDGGIYCLNATNQCGTSTICVVLNIYKDVKCHPDNEPAPVLSGCVNHTTVEGEMITFKCSFGDNFPPQFLDWELVLENGNSIIIGDHNDYTGFCMHTHQDCPLNNYSCCRFTSELSVHTNLLLNNATVSCNALVNNLTSFGVCHLSVVMRPTIAVPLTNVRAEEGKTVNFNCSVIATTMSGWTLFTWLKNNDTIRSNPKKYSNITEITPDESGNFIQSFLTIYNISKEDEGNYTFIVYYDPSVLKEFGINDKICNLTTAALLVKLHNKSTDHNSWPLWEIITSSVSAVVAAIIIAVISSIFYICRRIHGGEIHDMRNEALYVSDERSPLLQNSVTSDGEHTCADAPKVDMIILLLLVQTENNKFPLSENDGWLEDVLQLLKRIKPLVQLSNHEQNMIYDQRLEPEHRSLHLYKVIKERNKINEVSTLLYGIYYANRDLHHSEAIDIAPAHGSDNETSLDQPGSACSQEIHHHLHHHHHHHYNLNINAVKEQNVEEFLPDADNFANPLYQHATDFMNLVDMKTLSPVLIQCDLLTQHDMEYLQLPTIIDSDKKEFIFAKLMRLGKEGYEKFMMCLKDSYAMQHAGHIELYHKLSLHQ